MGKARRSSSFLIRAAPERQRVASDVPTTRPAPDDASATEEVSPRRSKPVRSKVVSGPAIVLDATEVEAGTVIQGDMVVCIY